MLFFERQGGRLSLCVLVDVQSAGDRVHVTIGVGRSQCLLDLVLG